MAKPMPLFPGNNADSGIGHVVGESWDGRERVRKETWFQRVAVGGGAFIRGAMKS